MVNLTDDGGVKKQILVQGVGNDVPPGSSVTGVLILFAISFQEKKCTVPRLEIIAIFGFVCWSCLLM